MHEQAADGFVVATEGKRAEPSSTVSPFAATFTVTHKMKIPAGLPDTDATPESRERRDEGKRIGESLLTVRAEYTLRPGSGRLEVRTVIENNAENHRLVVLTKNGIRTETLLAEGQFDITERVIKPWKGWKNLTKPGKMTTFFGLEDGEKGLLAATRGLCEYEVLRDGANTMSLTLHRGVDRLGDWGEFPTPEAQCKGTLTVEYALLPFAPTRADKERAVNGAYAFAAGEPASFCAATHAGTVPAAGAFCGVGGDGFVVSAVKMAENRDSVILRVFNPYPEDAKMKLDLGGRFEAAYEVNLGEERQRRIPVRNGKCSVGVKKKKIVTVELVPADH
jgi:alpha-mannosidase